MVRNPQTPVRTAALIFTLSLLPAAVAQEQPNAKPLLPKSTIEAIVNEVSGTLAYNFILDLAGYEHDRLVEEYRSTYREAAYIEKMAKQYGLEDVHIERFKIPTKTWDGELGELWLITPKEKRLLISYRDIPAMLATGSQSGDVTAEVVYVGRGEKDADYTGKDVKGKLVLASGAVGAVHNLAVRKYGAEAVITYTDPTGKPIDHPDQIAWNGLGRGFGAQGGGTQKTTFGFNVSHRLGMELLDMLERGEKITLRARARTTEYETDMQVPTAIIRGNGESQQEIAMTGHLFEGIAKQGAMDDASGSAVALEVARAWTKLIADGVLPRPRRTVRFLWIPEIQGPRGYLQRYPDGAKRMVAAISMDMVGEDTTKNKNRLHLMRTPYSVNGFINEVSQQFFEYVGDTNREKVQNRRIAYAYLFPILDPQGTRDQFNYVVDKHYGASDHAVFLGMGIPAVLYINWPDIAYHTSEDRPFNADPTQLKRVAFIGLASMHAMASAGPLAAIRIGELSEGYAAERTATELRRAMQMLGDGNADAQSYREALNLIHQAYAREADCVRSASVLAENSEAVSQIDALAKTFVETGEKTDAARLKEYATLIRHEPPVMYTMNAAEKEAASLVPVRKKPAPQGFGGGGGGGAGQGNRAPLAGFNAMEARNFADGKRTILDIRDAVSAEFGALDASKFVEFFRQLEKTGEFALNSKTDQSTTNQ